MPGIDSNMPNLAPIDVKTMTPEQLDAYADGIVSDAAKAGKVLTKDQVLRELGAIQTYGEKLAQTHLRRLLNGEPILVKPQNINFLSTLQTGVQGGNLFLKSYATVALKALREWASTMSDVKFQENAVIGIMALQVAHDMAKAVGRMHREIAEVEATMHLVSAIMNGVSGAFSIVMGGLTAGGVGKGKRNDMLYSTQMSAFQQGGSSLFRMGDDLAKAILTPIKGEMEELLEQFKFQQEQASKMRQDSDKAADEAQKDLDQAYNTLGKIVDQLMQSNPLKAA